MVTLDVAGATRSGDAVDLGDLADAPELPGPATVAAAVRDPADGRVDAPSPGPVHRHAGCITTDCSLSLRTAIAAAARSRGARAPQDEEIVALRVARRSVEVPDVSLAPARAALAEAETRVETQRERVARLGGAVAALAGTDDGGRGDDGDDGSHGDDGARGDDGDDGGRGDDGNGGGGPEGLAAARERHENAVAALAEAETDLIAARQELAAARERARAARDARERRLAVTDRLENRRRSARATLARAWYERFAAALSAVPGSADPGPTPAAFEGPDWTAALAIAQLASMEAPVIVADGLFADAGAAHRTLGTPVVVVPEG